MSFTERNFIQEAKEIWDDVVIDTIYDENASSSDIYKLAFVLAVFVFISFELLRPVIRKILKGPLQQILWKAVNPAYDRCPETREKYTKEECYELYVSDTTGKILEYSSHIVGGLFAIPAVFGMVQYSHSVRSSLACLSILHEMGYEIQDLCRIFYNRLFMGELGKETYPNIHVIGSLIHHSLTSIMGPPMILNYRDLPELHRLSFNLQGVAGLAGLFLHFSQSLDVTKKGELFSFILGTFLVLIMFVWTRFVDWFYISYKLLTTFYADEKWTYLCVGSVVMSLFTIFNLLICIIPIYQRFIKFWKKWRDFESLPEDADEIMRRSTVQELRNSAAELAAIELNPVEVLTNLFEQRKVERRHTITISEISRSADALASSIAGARASIISRLPRQTSMIAWRNLPSREKKRQENKSD